MKIHPKDTLIIFVSELSLLIVPLVFTAAVFSIIGNVAANGGLSVSVDRLLSSSSPVVAAPAAVAVSTPDPESFVVLKPSAVTLSPGQLQRFTVFAYDRFENPTTLHGSLVWSSTREAGLFVNTEGMFITGYRLGTFTDAVSVRIVTESGVFTSTVDVRVVDW